MAVQTKLIYVRAYQKYNKQSKVISEMKKFHRRCDFRNFFAC